MGALSQLAKCAAAGLIGLLAWNVAAKLLIDNTVNSPEAQAEGQLWKMEREAQVAQPGKPTAVAMTQYAIEKASTELAAAPEAERAFKAAQIFIGYYLVNTRARVEFCAERHVDLGKFADEFARLHAAQYERAVALLTARGLKVEQIWSITRTAMSRAITHDMGGFTAPGIHSPKACEEVARQARYFARKLDLKTRQPEVQRALMG
jgi:hypothetical protein